MAETTPYAARLEIDYPEQLDRVTTFFRLILAIPIVVILALLTAPPPPGSSITRAG